MAIADDISVAINGDIRYTGSTANYTVLELHQFLSDIGDDANPVTTDDLYDISIKTASDRSTDTFITLLDHTATSGPVFNIDDTLAQHLYAGSIVQKGGDEIYDGIVNYGVAGIYIDVIQDGAVLTNFWTTGLNADAAQGISHQFMLKVRTAGADIDGRRLLGTTREFGKTYSEFSINGTKRGENVLALTNSDDLNNATAVGTVAGWTTITNTTEGYVGIDVDADTVDEFYYSEWNTDQPTRSINDFYERMKWLTRRGTSSSLYGLNGALFRGITHEIVVDTPTGTFAGAEELTWGSGATAGTGQLLAINSPTAATKLWMQLLTGVLPTDGLTLTGTTSSATVDVNVTITQRPLSPVFVGSSTGTSIVGGYGVGIEAADLVVADKVFDLDNAQVSPPNNVTFTVGGLVSGEDRVLVGPASGNDFDYTQLALNTTLSGATETAIVCTASIPSDTPASGTVRIQTDAGVWRRVAYTSYTGSTFTIPSTDFTGSNVTTAGNNLYISYIDKLAAATSEGFTTIYSSDRNLYIRVRDGGTAGDTIPIKTFQTTGTLTNAGGSATAIRTSDA